MKLRLSLYAFTLGGAYFLILGLIPMGLGVMSDTMNSNANPIKFLELQGLISVMFVIIGSLDDSDRLK